MYEIEPPKDHRLRGSKNEGKYFFLFPGKLLKLFELFQNFQWVSGYLSTNLLNFWNLWLQLLLHMRSFPKEWIEKLLKIFLNTSFFNKICNLLLVALSNSLTLSRICLRISSPWKIFSRYNHFFWTCKIPSRTSVTEDNLVSQQFTNSSKGSTNLVDFMFEIITVCSSRAWITLFKRYI